MERFIKTILEGNGTGAAEAARALESKVDPLLFEELWSALLPLPFSDAENAPQELLFSIIQKIIFPI